MEVDANEPSRVFPNNWQVNRPAPNLELATKPLIIPVTHI
jgi:hypothetical protein